MEGGNSRTSAVLEAKFKRVLAENGASCLWLFFFNSVIFFSILALDYHKLIPRGIAEVLTTAVSFLSFVFIYTYVLNVIIIFKLKDGGAEGVLKWFRREIVAALLLFQPRAYALMK